MPRIAHIFKGTSTKLAPGREAVPYHFFDSDLHRHPGTLETPRLLVPLNAMGLQGGPVGLARDSVQAKGRGVIFGVALYS